MPSPNLPTHGPDNHHNSNHNHTTHWLKLAILAALIYAILCALSQNSLSAQPTTIPIAVTGDSAPGTAGATFDNSFSPPLLNNHGRIAFKSDLTGLGISSINKNGIWTWHPGGLTKAAQLNDPAPDAPGTFYAIPFFRNLQYNDFDQVAFNAYLTGAVTPGLDDEGIWVGPTGATNLVVRANDPTPTPGVVYTNTFSGLSLSDAGNVTFASFLDGPTVNALNNEAISAGPPGAVNFVARLGDPAPGTPPGVLFGRSTIFPLVMSPNGINGNNQHIVHTYLSGSVTPGLDDEGIWVGPTGGLQLLARNGSPAPTLGPGVNFTTFTSITNGATLNNNAQVAFGAEIAGTGITTGVNDQTLWLGTPGNLNLIAQTGTPAPGTATGTNFDSFYNNAFLLNGAGHITFEASLTGPGVTPFKNHRGLWLGTPGNLKLVARDGQSAPGTTTGTTFNSVHVIPPALNGNGQIVFETELTGPGVSSANDQALYISDGEQLLLIARSGDTPLGSPGGATINDIFLTGASGGQSGYATGFNDFGQAAYRASFTGGDQGIFLYTPQLHWRRTNPTGQWDNNDNWTVSIKPARVHDVLIDTDASLTVFGPTSDTTVNSFQVGGGAGLATLWLQSGASINVNTTQLFIESTGQLTGDGTINAEIQNHGTVHADNLTFTGTLVNHKIVTGDGRINGTLFNTPDGEVRVASTDHLRFNKHANINQGRIEVLGGQLEFDGDITNQNATGIIYARNATLRFNDALTNHGSIALSFGTTDVFGDITNEPTGRIVITGSSNATFIDDLVNDGAVQTSAGSQLVLLGDVSGTGPFPGTGTVFVEGDLRPGHSPAAIPFGGNLVLGPFATTQIEAQAPTPLPSDPVPGIDHDQLTVTNNVTLNGTLDAQLLSPTNRPILGTSYTAITFNSRTPASFFHTINGTLIDTDFALAPLLDDTAKTFTLRATIPGDLNLDNKVSVADLAEFALNFNTSPGLHNETENQSSWLYGDFNTDGLITVADLSLLALNFGFDATDPTSTPTPLSLSKAATLAGIDLAILPGALTGTLPGVPEPTTALIILTAALPLTTRTATKRQSIISTRRLTI